MFRDAVCAGGRDRASGGFGIDVDVVGLALQTAGFFGPGGRPQSRGGAFGCRQPVLVIRGRDDVLSSADWERRLAGQAADGDYVELLGAHTFSRGHPSAS